MDSVSSGSLSSSPTQSSAALAELCGTAALVRRSLAGTGNAERDNGESDVRRAAVAVIAGTAGVGKTTLAMRWAHYAAGQFPIRLLCSREPFCLGSRP